MDTNELILKYFNDSLTSDEKIIFQKNFEDNTDFREEVRDMARMLGSLKAMEKMPAKKSFPKRWIWILLLLTSFCITILIVLNIFHKPDQQIPDAKEINNESPIIAQKPIPDIQSQNKVVNNKENTSKTEFKINEESNQQNNVSNNTDYTSDERDNIKDPKNKTLPSLNECGDLLVFSGKKGSRLIAHENVFFPFKKHSLKIRFKEIFDGDELLNADFVNSSSLNGYLGIHKILFVSIVNNTGDQKIKPHFEKCSTDVKIYIPVDVPSKMLNIYQLSSNSTSIIIEKDENLEENDTNFMVIHTKELSAINLASFIPLDKSDIKLKIKDNLWVPAIINILCFNESDGLYYTGIKTSEGNYTFPAFLNPDSAVLFLKIKYQGKVCIYKGGLSMISYDEKEKTYILKEDELSLFSVCM